LTCRHFRRSVAANVGYCGLDRRRAPLLGDEIRACWEGGPFSMAPAIPAARARLAVIDGAPVRQIEFVEVTAGPVGASADQAAAIDVADSGLPEPRSAAPDEPRWSLWEDPTV
jgi:hypothetical protein